jgi:hypothetical protein
MTRLIRLTIVMAALLTAIAASGRGDEPGEDLITLRDGGTKTGKVESCDGSGCTIGGNRIARETIMSIRLGGQSALNLQNPSQDKIQLTDGSVLTQTMTSVDAARVAGNQGTFPRGQVAWIYFAAKRAQEAPGHWHGTLVWSLHQMVPSGPQDWNGRADVRLDSDAQAKVTGVLTGTQTQTLGLARGHAHTDGTVKATLSGKIDGQRMSLAIVDPQASWPEETPCREGLSARTGASVFKWPHLAEVFQNLSPSSDGSYHYEREWPMPPPNAYTLRYILDLKPRTP